MSYTATTRSPALAGAARALHGLHAPGLIGLHGDCTNYTRLATTRPRGLYIDPQGGMPLGDPDDVMTRLPSLQPTTLDLPRLLRIASASGVVVVRWVNGGYEWHQPPSVGQQLAQWREHHERKGGVDHGKREKPGGMGTHPGASYEVGAA